MESLVSKGRPDVPATTARAPRRGVRSTRFSFDHQALPGGQFQYRYPAGKPGIFGVLLGAIRQPTIVVQDQDRTRNHAIEQYFQRADFRVGIIQVQMHEGDLLGRDIVQTSGTLPWLTVTLGRSAKRCVTQLNSCLLCSGMA